MRLGSRSIQGESAMVGIGIQHFSEIQNLNNERVADYLEICGKMKVMTSIFEGGSYLFWRIIVSLSN